MTVIPVIIIALGAIQKCLEIKDRIETIQTTTLLKSMRILRKIMEYWKDLLQKAPVWKPGKKNNAKNAHNSLMVKNYCLCKLVQSSLNIQILWSCACLIILIKDNGIKVRRIIWNFFKNVWVFAMKEQNVWHH